MPAGGDFRKIALSLPEAVEKGIWGHPTFRVCGTMFAGNGRGRWHLRDPLLEAWRLTAPILLVKTYDSGPGSVS